MNSVGYLIPISLGLGLIALGAFLWSLDRAQYEDIEGASNRILSDEDCPEQASVGTDAPPRGRTSGAS